MLVVFSPIFMADTKIICDYNFVAPLIISFKMLSCSAGEKLKLLLLVMFLLTRSWFKT